MEATEGKGERTGGMGGGDELGEGQALGGGQEYRTGDKGGFREAQEGDVRMSRGTGERAPKVTQAGGRTKRFLSGGPMAEEV